MNDPFEDAFHERSVKTVLSLMSMCRRNRIRKREEDMRKNIWIDTDPGIDDAIAIAAAFASSDRLRILGISTVAGNQTIDIVTKNALWLREILGGKDVSVVRGAPRPLIRRPHPVGSVHGVHGLGYVVPEETGRIPDSDQGAANISRCIQELPEGEKITIVPIGPLTNIALLIRACPDAARRIDKIVLMGGSSVEGNITATAEYNIWADPEAAEIVFQSGIPIVMCGLDVTMKCLLSMEDILTLENGGALQKQFARMLQFYFDSTAYQGKGYVAMHDSVPFLYLLHEELFSGQQHIVHVSCTEDTCRGMTVVCDAPYTYQPVDEPKNVFIVKNVDSGAFRRELMDRLMSL